MAAGKKKTTVVIADDDRTIRTVLAKVLDTNGYRVELADRGEKCLFLALERDVDAFLIDMQMPGLDGIELCRRLRAIDRYRIAPIMFITSHDEDANLSEGFAAGATDLINKPVNPVVLQARLKAHLDRVRYFNETEKVRDYLKRYISVRTQRIAEAYAMTGVLPVPERTTVCVMFSDVRGFTTLSRSVQPEELFDSLSRLLGMQVDIVHRCGGYIDKFGGDGIMAIFTGEDMALDACHCARHILREVGIFQEKGLAWTLPVGIGIAMGDVLIGNIGSSDHLDYSAIGETVNLAARLCGQAPADQVLVSGSVYEAAKDDELLSFGEASEVRVKGFSEPVQVRGLLGTRRP